MSDGQVEKKEEEVNFLEMSDADIMNMSAPPVTTEVVASVETVVVEEETVAEVVADEPGGSPGEEVAAEATTGEQKEVVEGVKEAVKEKPAEKVEEEKPTQATNYEEEYKKLLAPFKANGKDIQVNSVDDAISLMQMGANYNKKMAALKPSLKLMKMLENNGLLSEEKIGYLIDLEKKVPGAVNKLVSESGIEPMDLDAEKAKTYKQTSYAVDDREIELDTVLDSLQGTPTYTRTLDVVSNKWDVASKQAVSQNPQLLTVINDHMASGIYDLISAEIDRERVFGRLNGVSDIEAYRQVGDSMNARGGFNHLGKPPVTKDPVAVAPVVVQPKPKVADDGALNDKRRAASPTKGAAPTVTPTDFNPLNMSDEEFAKISNPRYR